MSVEWDLYEAGPTDAAQTVLLLPGGMSRAQSLAELMAEPALAGVRLVAATLPGHAGTPAPDDAGIEHAAALTAKLATDIGCDVVYGFSIGATVALEMVVSGAFSGPVVLSGISLSTKGEAGFMRGLDKLSAVTGTLPWSVMRQMMRVMMKQQKRLPEARRAELLDDLMANDAATWRRVIHAYLQYLGRDDAALRLCTSGVPAWVVHAEKGDGGLTADERGTLEACPNVEVCTIPGSVFLLPNEVPDQLAQFIAAALARA